jgi:glycosyltransferase involved in cell wall biosynthesis
LVVRIGIDGRYIQDHYPGIGRYTYNLVSKLPEVAQGAEFVLLHDPRPVNTRYDVELLSRHANLEVVTTDIPAVSVQEQYGLRSLIKTLSLDLLHSPYVIKPYWLPCPSVVTVYDLIPLIYPQYLPHRWTSWVFRAATSVAVRHATQVIAISDSTKTDLTRLFGATQGKTTAIPLAADERFRPLAREQWRDVVRSYALPERYALYMGINKPHKNLVFLLRVFSELGTDATLVLAGKEDPRYPQAREETRRLGLADRVLFLGEIPDADLPALYNGAQAFVFPSLYEGFGLPVLEAMACGVPVVCSNTSSMPEIVGDAAIILDPQDVDAWVATLTEVLNREALRAEMRRKGQERAKMFSWEETARNTWHVYQAALEGDQRARAQGTPGPG